MKIGLEVHIYVLTQSKLFCSCSSDFLAAEAPNVHVCARCSGQPGAKPLAPNAAALEAAIRLARALGARLEPRARFLRKHYFYPDSPANYQRTSEPIAREGMLSDVALTELHVEEDPGAYDPGSGLVDLNRAGAPLIELVTEPTLTSPAHARRFLQELRLVLSYLGISNESAGLKADCNASLDGGERVEVKNVSGLRNVERALESELARQREVVARGGRVVRETRAFDDASGTTTSLREKQSEADYRFLADPDVAPVDVAWLERSLPAEEAPLARRARFAQQLSLPDAEVSPLVEEKNLADAYERAAVASPRVAYDFLVRDVRAELEYRKIRLAASGLDAEELASLVEALALKSITPQVATRVLRDALDGKARLGALMAIEAAHETGDDALAGSVREAIAANPKAVADYRAGKPSAVNFLVGQAMRRLAGRGDANALRAMVIEALEKGEPRPRVD